MARARGTITELKIPAQAQFVMVAKRTASGLAAVAGFSLQGIDDLNIALAQACDRSIAAGDRLWGAGNALLKISFRMVEGGMEVDVKTIPARVGSADEVARRRQGELLHQAEVMRQAAQRLSAEVEAERGRVTAERERADPELDYEDVAVNMIRMFVDELRHNVDSSGAVRMRLVKYVVD
ncbi:MAG: hypothetical protein ACYDGR_09060 [Candidatus Dormibacteria bacterium]